VKLPLKIHGRYVINNLITSINILLLRFTPSTPGSWDGMVAREGGKYTLLEQLQKYKIKSDFDGLGLFNLYSFLLHFEAKYSKLNKFNCHLSLGVDTQKLSKQWPTSTNIFLLSRNNYIHQLCSLM
jgi:hypothetical protein